MPAQALPISFYHVQQDFAYEHRTVPWAKNSWRCFPSFWAVKRSNHESLTIHDQDVTFGFYGYQQFLQSLGSRGVSQPAVPTTVLHVTWQRLFESTCKSLRRKNVATSVHIMPGMLCVLNQL